MTTSASGRAGAAGSDPASCIALIGMMGSGKSAVGRALAELLGRELVDVDDLVAAAAGRPVATIFAEEGEAGFRAREAVAVREAAGRKGAVIACGGGVVLTPANVEVLRAAGTVIWLRVRPKVAAARLGTDAGRPILQAGGGDLIERLAALTAARAEAYRAAAHHVVDADGPVDDVVEQVLAGVASPDAPPATPPDVRP